MKLKILASVLISFAWVSLAHAQSPKDLMGVMGDSISAASLAGTYLVKPPANHPVDPYGGNGQLYENRAYFSWASGSQILSHYERLKAIYSADPSRGSIDIYNIAEPGAQSSKLEAQADAIRKTMQGDQGYTALEYVTILAGANDVCSDVTPQGTPNSEIYAEFMKAFARLALIKQNRKIKVLISSLPSIPDLAKPEIAEVHSPIANLKCGELYQSSLFYCKNLDKWHTQAQYEAEMAVIESKNKLLAQIAIDGANQYPSLDIRFSTGVSQYRLKATDLAEDCFHPNAITQDIISEVIWRDQPWY